MTRRKNKTQRHSNPPLAASQETRPPVAALHKWLLAAMTAFFVARPLFPSESAATYGDGLTMVMLWIALAVFWLLGAIGRPRFSIRFGWTDAAVLLLIGWNGGAALWTVGHGAPRPAINMLWEWLGMGLCFLMARQLIDTEREARAVAAVMVALAVALSGYGLYQYGYELPNTRAEYKADPDRVMRQAGLWFPPDSPERQLFESRLACKEPMATFALTNSLAAFLATWLVVLAGIGAASMRNRKRLWGLLLCGIPIVACLILTKSRSGYIASGVGLLLVWLVSRAVVPAAAKKLFQNSPLPLGEGLGVRARITGNSAICPHPNPLPEGEGTYPKPLAEGEGTSIETADQRKRKLWLLAIGIAVMAFLAVVILGGPGRALLDRAAQSFGYRVQYWQSSLGIIADHPIVGCGPGNFQNVYPQCKLPEAAEEVADPHNFLLEIAATAGIPAALAFLAVLGCFGWTTWRRAEEENEEREMRNEERASPPSALRPPPSSNPQSLIPNPAPSALRPPPSAFILGGGVFGFLLSVPVGMLSAAPQSFVVIMLGLPLAIAAMFLLHGWVQEGQLPRWLPALGVVVLLVDLSTTGGIGYPSIAGSFWLLLALGLQGDRPRALRPSVAWVALAATVVLAAACYRTAYSPVLECQAQLRLAERESARAVEHLEAAAAADPWSAEPWRQLAALEFERWLQRPNQESFDRFERAVGRSIELAPNSAPSWLAAGDFYFQAFSKMDQNDPKVAAVDLNRARSVYGEAVRLYPNNAVYRIKLAEAHRAAGDMSGFRREAEAALRLDSLTPHTNKKLPADVRKRLRQTLDAES